LKSKEARLFTGGRPGGLKRRKRIRQGGNKPEFKAGTIARGEEGIESFIGAGKK